MLSAKADGTKLKPFVLLPRKRQIKELDKYRGKLVIKYEGTSWMNEKLTETYIKDLIEPSLFGRRLLVWDSFKCHITPGIKKFLQKRKVDMAVIPGGCTKFVQPADVSWNKPFKDCYRELYEAWMEKAEFEYTKGGNPKGPPLDLVCQWIITAWESVSAEIIKKSFKVCGINVAVDGSEDDRIQAFKAPGGEVGLEKLKAWQVAEDQEMEEDVEEEEKMMLDSEDDSDDEVLLEDE